jgi:preprotein translocase subunit SecA
LSHVELRVELPEEAFERRLPREVRELHDEFGMFGEAEAEAADQLAATGTNGAAPPVAQRGSATIISRRPAPRGKAGAPPPPGWVRFKHTGAWLDPKDTSTWGRVPRNAPCPCGSGKKYKHCHGAV